MSASSLRKDADELIRLAMLTEIENVKRILTSEATRLVQAAEAEEKLNQGAQKKVIRPAYTTTKLYNYGWDQSDKYLKIYLTMNGIQNFPADSVNANFEAKSIEICILDEGKKINYVLTVHNLLHPIIAAESYFKVKTDMVVVFLKKTSPVNWQCVTEVEKKSKEAKTPRFDKEEDAGASLMSLMKQMYDDGDDEMKRTIAKAWTEARDKKSPDELM
ncbi:calcyclin-binding protein [Trichonephila inaurata madagascariensis]|uniref:Calcyclin-binding protein n=1 Tax=Trichonephila inaurata madagascariensis TaxID=2747483 RepID=A0A8X7C0B9_9ARAC|nr:calcyclin-binding protein [Trichonephila inaurata madagascariensis]